MKRIPITEIVNDAFVSRNDEIFCQGVLSQFSAVQAFDLQIKR